MTLKEAYSHGWHDGRLWAEKDLRDGSTTSRADTMRKFIVRMPEARAWHLGVCRGYRDTVDRFERGVLTWEMFDEAPLGT